MHSTTLVVYAFAAVLLLIAGYLLIVAVIHARLRLRRYRKSDVGLDHAMLQDELTTHAHLTLIDAAPQPGKRSAWWQRLG